MSKTRLTIFTKVAIIGCAITLLAVVIKLLILLFSW